MSFFLQSCYNEFGDTMNEIKMLLELLESFKTPQYKELPEIDLYMDQVLTYIKKHLPPVKDQDKDILTGSMINNYVKDDVIKNPTDKKYDKDAIASLIMVANLKRVLPISDIKQIISGNDVESLYQIYQEQLGKIIKDIVKKDSWSIKDDQNDLTQIALALAVDAAMKSYLAHMILSNNQKAPIKEKKKKEPKEPKDK